MGVYKIGYLVVVRVFDGLTVVLCLCVKGRRSWVSCIAVRNPRPWIGSTTWMPFAYVVLQFCLYLRNVLLRFGAGLGLLYHGTPNCNFTMLWHIVLTIA